MRRSLVVAGLAAAVLLLPGVAWADDGSAPLSPPTDPVGSVAGAVGNVLDGAAAGGGSDPSAGTAAGADAGPLGSTGTQSADPSLPAPPSQLDPAQLQALLGALGISPECSAAVQQDLQAAIQDLPASVQAIVDAIVGQLGSGPPSVPISVTDPQTGATLLLQDLGNGQPPTFSSPDPAELPTVKDLQQLADDLQKLCLPQPPTSGGSPPPPPPQQPASSPQPPAAAPAPAQPVSYPGYAPTGAAPADSSGGGSLLWPVGIVLLSAASAASYRMVFRAGPRP